MKTNRYTQIIESIFAENYSPGAEEVEFQREDIVKTATALGIKLPKNIGDVIYSFRYRATFPDSILVTAPEGKEWVIRATGQARYQFALAELSQIKPTSLLTETKILDGTPGLITRYAISDEQGLLAKVRYNRLIDVFTRRSFKFSV